MQFSSLGIQLHCVMNIIVIYWKQKGFVIMFKVRRYVVHNNFSNPFDCLNYIITRPWKPRYWLQKKNCPCYATYFKEAVESEGPSPYIITSIRRGLQSMLAILEALFRCIHGIDSQCPRCGMDLETLILYYLNMSLPRQYGLVQCSCFD